MKHEPDQPCKPSSLPSPPEKPYAYTLDRDKPERPTSAPAEKPRDPRRYDTREMRPRRPDRG